ncbi:MAG: Fe(2+)-trafficking protein [Planctomycetota bacterium]
MDLETRIAQFEKMAADDADNDMAHFSLGGAYQQAGRFADAAECYIRCFGINPAMSKAYQLAGAALIAADDTDRAGPILLEGYVNAGKRGDLMPQRAMGDMLDQLGIEKPEVQKEAPKPAADGSFVCRRTGKPGTKMPHQPFKGPVGEWIHANISKESFDEWIGQGTKVINELRLDLSRDQDGDTYDAHMREFLGIDDAMYEELTGEKPKASV